MMVSTQALTVLVAGLLAISAFLLGMVAARRPKPAAPSPPHPVHPASSSPLLSPSDNARLEQQAKVAFEAAVERATNQFGKDLDGTSKRLSELIIKLTTNVVEKEFEEYKQSLVAARTSALEALGKMQQEIEQRQRSLQGDVDARLAQRQQELLERLDRKLGEAAAAYIVESLGQGADLGAQRGWLLDSLERHKADLKKDLTDEA